MRREKSNNKWVKRYGGTKIFRRRKRSRDVAICRLATPFLGHALSDIAERASNGGGEGAAKVFPSKFSRLENTLRDALLNIRLTPRRLLGILIDKFYPGRASYSKLGRVAPSARTNLEPPCAYRLLNAPIRVPDAVDCLISSRPY